MGHLGRLATGLALLAGTALTAITAFTSPTASAAAPAPATTAPASTAPATTGTVPRLDHVFLIMEENNGYSDVIGNQAAPNLNYLASTFGVATDYYGISTGSSETNYVALLGGSPYNVTSDDAYWKNKVDAPSLITQLDQAGVSWKAYLQGLPYAGYQGICYPARCNGAPDSDPLYVSKHDTIQNFTTSWNAADWSRQIPIGQLSSDLKSGDVPRFDYVVPDECHDMHGDPPYCLDSGSNGDPQQQHLDSVGDAYLGQLVSEITHATFWAQGNNAIIVTFDNGDDTKGCCDANPGGGQVATVVVTSHGPRGVTDSQPANHYSTLSSIEQSFGLGCLQATCDTKNVTPLSSLLAVTGSTAIATKVQPELSWPTPTPSQPAEPLSETKPVAGPLAGWQVLPAQLLGTSDNSLGAIAGSSPSDIWAVGNYLPDAAGSNQDATLTFAEHWNGSSWQVVRTPNAGPNFNSFYGLAAKDGDAWAVGEHLNSAYQDRLLDAVTVSDGQVWVAGESDTPSGGGQPLVERYADGQWETEALPALPDHSNWANLYGIAVAGGAVWVEGTYVDPATDNNNAIVLKDAGGSWTVDDGPDPGSGSNILGGITAVNGELWLAGTYENGGSREPLVARR